MSKKTTPAAPASAPAPAPTPVTASAGTPGDMAAALADNDDVMVATGSTADAPVVQTSVEPEPASGKSSETPAASKAPEPDDEEARLAARIAELGDPHSLVVAAAGRLAEARKDQFETSIALEQAVNAAMDNLRRVQAKSQMDKEEIRLCKLRLEQISAARDAAAKAVAATAAQKAKTA